MSRDEKTKPKPRNFEDLLERFGKYCPKCHSGQVSSDNSTPLNHKCLDCGVKFVDCEAIIGYCANKELFWGSIRQEILRRIGLEANSAPSNIEQVTEEDVRKWAEENLNEQDRYNPTQYAAFANHMLSKEK